jgi:predicted O-methyltransferase YrrM
MIQLNYVIYGFKHPKRALDFVLKERKLANLLCCSVDEVKFYLKELDEIQLIHTLESELKRYNLPLGTMLTPLRAPILYTIVRVLKPSTVVETGVATGVSTTLILKALSLNRSGHLFSIHMPNLDPLARLPEGKNVGWLVPDDLKERWHLTLGLSKDELKPLLQELGSIDLFLHDSEHSYENMMFEFKTAYSFLRKQGILLADDITANNAFRDFLRMNKPAYWTAFGGLGAVRK